MRKTRIIVLGAALALAVCTVVAIPARPASAATPAKVKIASVKSTTDSITIKVKKTKGAKGYQYQATWRKSFKKDLWSPMSKKSLKRVMIFKDLGGTNWRVRVRAWGKTKGKTVWGTWSAVKMVKLVKKKPTDTEDDSIDNTESETFTEEVNKFMSKIEDHTATRSDWDDIRTSWLVKKKYGGTNWATDEEKASYKKAKEAAFPHSYKCCLFSAPEDGKDFWYYLETNNPSTSWELCVSNENNDQVFTFIISKYSSTYADLHGTMTNGVYRTAGGYISLKWLPKGDYTFWLGEYKKADDGLQNLGDIYFGKIKVDDGSYTTERYNKWMDSVIAEAVPDRTIPKGDQLQQIADWLLAHNRYPYNDSQGVYYLFSNQFMEPWDYLARGEKFEADSATSPAMLKKFADYIGYPVEDLFQKYARGTADWTRYHMCVYSKTDNRYFQCCPLTDTGYMERATVGKFNPETYDNWYAAMDGRPSFLTVPLDTLDTD